MMLKRNISLNVLLVLGLFLPQLFCQTFDMLIYLKDDTVIRKAISDIDSVIFQEKVTVTDIDGNVYRTVTIGNQVWMAENLKVTKYRDGTDIPNVTGNSTWANLSTGAYCYYNNDNGNADTYGALYNWYAVNGDTDGNGTKDKEIAPEGWHVPTTAEWQELVTYLGGSSVAGNKLKSTSGWSSGNGTDEVEFTVFPGGYRLYNTGNFSGIGNYAAFWTSTEYNTYFTAYYYMLYYNSDAIDPYSTDERFGVSVRCVQD